MTTQQGTSERIWKRISTRSETSVLLGRKIPDDWLKQSEWVAQVRFNGTAAALLRQLLDAAKLKKKGMNLPIAALRVGLASGISGLIALEKNLGLLGNDPAIEILCGSEELPAEERNSLGVSIVTEVSRWMRDTVAEWAHSHEIDGPLVKLLEALQTQSNCVDVRCVRKGRIDENGKPNFTLIARSIGELLISEELFGPDMGEVELVGAEFPSNTIELMTLPKRLDRQVISMVACITIGTMPFVPGVFLNTRVMKRVWADKLPTQKFGSQSPRRVTGYVMRPGHPAIPVSVGFKNGWDFGDDYKRVLNDSQQNLASTLADAVKQRDFLQEKGWWSGLQELPSLYRYLAPRTPFEVDEAELLNAVASALSQHVKLEPLEFKEVATKGKLAIGSTRSKTEMHMLRTSDIGVAGASLQDELLGEDDADVEDTDESATDSNQRTEDIKLYRERNIRFLESVHGESKPLLWVIGGTVEQQAIIESVSKSLFGDKVEVAKQGMPLGVHGLQNALPGGDLPTKERFELRVKAWKPLTDNIAAFVRGTFRMNFALICAANEEGGKPEDPVNYYAGIHAMSLIGANVHHVLPPDASTPDTEEKAKENFLQRVQSALLDVFLAHAGLVANLQDFVQSLYGDKKPKAIYGVQAVRSLIKVPGETSVAFILFTRLPVDSGVVEANFVYRSGSRTMKSGWMRLSSALTWLGKQRHMKESDNLWLKANFVNETKSMLSQIAQEDPCAVVLIDQEPVHGLWPGIRDEDINATGKAMIGGVDLTSSAVIKNMTLVRIRRNANTIGLRTLMQTSFESAGETSNDDYYTTAKKIVDLTPGGSTGRSYGQFITTMGYSNKAQGKRGSSCYKKTERFVVVGKGTDEKGFIRKEMTPPRTEMPLPAPSDVTVLHCPTDIEPAAVAVLVTGLRVGAAHFNDWTSLPAPLFYQRKVDDYIIRFPDTAGPDNSNDPPVRSSAGTTNPTEKAAESSDELQPETVVAAAAPEVIISGLEDEVFPKGPALPEPLPEKIELASTDEQLIEQVFAAASDSVWLWDRGHNGQMYEGMMRGSIRVRVEVPFFVKPRELFGETTKLVRRYQKKVWERLRELQLVRNSGVNKPSEDEFLGWLASNYIHKPQACVALAHATVRIGTIQLSPLVHLVHKFNEGREEKIDPASYRGESITTLMEWAHATNDDALMAWVAFQVAQVPRDEWLDAFSSSLKRVLGPMSRSALRYFVRSTHAAIAVSKIDKSSSGMTNLVYHATDEDEADAQLWLKNNESVASTGAVPELSAVARAVSQFSKKTALVREVVSVTASELTEEKPVEVIREADQKDKSAEVVESAEKASTPTFEMPQPGSDDFNDKLDKVQSLLSELEAQHKSILEHRQQALQSSLLRNELMDELTQLLKSIHDNGILSQCLITLNVDAENVDLIVDKDIIAKARALVEDVQSLNARVEQLHKMPTPKVPAERIKLGKLRVQCDEQVAESEERLKAALTAFATCNEQSDDTVQELTDAAGMPDSAPDAEDAVTSLPMEVASTAVVIEAPLVIEQAQAEPVAAEVSTVLPIPEAVIPSQQEASLMDESLVQPEQTFDARPVAHGAAEIHAIPIVKEKQPDLAQPLISVEVIENDNPFQVTSQVDAALGQEFEHQIGVLNTLMNCRLYALGDVQTRALLAWLNNAAPNGDHKKHAIVMANVVGALYDVDGKSNFDFQISNDMKQMLDSGELPESDIKDMAILAVGVLACGLPMMLFEKSDWQWNIGNAVSSRLSGHSALADLTEHLDLIRRHGMQLNRSKFLDSNVGSSKAASQAFVQLAKKAANWSESGEIYTNWGHKGFRQMHEELFAKSSFIGKCLSAIAEGNLAKAQTAFDEGRRRFDKPDATVNEYFKRIGELSKPDGKMRSWAVENINKTRKFIEECLSFSETHHTSDDKLGRLEKTFLVELDKKLSAAITEVKLLSARTTTESFYLHAATTILQRALDLYNVPKDVPYIRNDVQQLWVQLPLDRDLLPAMHLCDTEEIFEECERLAAWAKEKLPVGVDATHPVILEFLHEELDIHLGQGRFLPAFLIEGLIPRQSVRKEDSVAHKHARSLATFSTKLQGVRARVTHAMALNAIPTDEAAEMLRIVESVNEVRQSQPPMGHPDCTSSNYPDLPHALDALERYVEGPLGSKLSEADQKLRVDLDVLEEKVTNKMSTVSLGDIQRIRNMLDKKNAASIRTAFDLFQTLQQGGRLPEIQDSVVDIAKAFEDFISEITKNCTSQKPLMESVCDHLASDKPSKFEWINNMTPEHRQEAAQFIQQWRGLFQNKNPRGSDEFLSSIFKSIGVNEPPTVDMSSTNRSNRLMLNVPPRIFTLPPNPVDDVFVPPELGSRAQQIEGCVVFGDISAPEFLQLKRGSTPVVVLQHARLGLKKRAELSWISHFIILDDDLLMYMAMHKPEERLRCMLRVCVLTYGGNPYGDYKDVPVPAEMFFGRQQELDRLRNVQSVGVLYGGRRLGKSSLLGQLEQESRQSTNKYAVMINLHDVNASGDYVLEVFRCIAVHLHRRGLINSIPENVAHDRHALVSYIEEEIIRRPSIQSLYLLIDESDDTMGREINRPESEIGLVRSLLGMASRIKGANGCHVRFVFAGLHNVTRMTNEGNSAFGKSETIALETFQGETMRGIRLITKPLAAMGYLFSGAGADDMPLRILSYCNFYPALIQLYCSRLLDHLQNNRSTKKPSLQITSHDLDDVESDQKLHEQMQQLFKHNLDLDRRYRAISLMLAHRYYESLQAGGSAGLTLDEIRELCSALFGNLFGNAGTGAFEALLAEMQKLTFLVRTGNLYYLRNPHIAMMIGDRSRVHSLIDDLSKQPPEKARNHGERRVILQSNKLEGRRTQLPLPCALMTHLFEKSGKDRSEFNDQGLIILTGNRVSGIMELPSLARDEWVPSSFDDWSLEVYQNALQLRDFLKAERRITLDKNRRSNILGMPFNVWTLEQLPEYIASAGKAAKKGSRIFLMAQPDRAWQLALAMDSAAFAGHKGCKILPIPQWTEDALYFKLQSKDPSLASNPTVLSSILTASGGYEKEVNAICADVRNVESAIASVEAARKGWARSLPSFYERIGMPVATIPADELSRAESALIFLNGTVKGSEDEDDALSEYKVSQGMFHFLQWMGLLNLDGNGQWKLPALYAQLLADRR